MPIIAPSLLSANFINLQADCEMLNSSVADWYHLDVMDGTFLPNITFGPMIIEFLRKASTKTFDVHLMIEHPEKYAEAFQKAGADILTVHYEACTHLHRNIQQIKSLGMKAGVALNPHTPVELLKDNGKGDFMKELCAAAIEENKKPVEQIRNLVKEIYNPFTTEKISAKISEMLKNSSIRAEVEVVYQSVEGLHIACPGHTGDWYFTGDYPTPGGNRVANQSFINFMEGRDQRAY